MNNLIAATGGILTNPALGELGKNTGEGFFQKAIPAGIGMIFLIAVLIFFFQIAIGAIQWIQSGGDKQSLETSRGKITNAVIGLVVLFAAFAIIKLVEAFFHINILTLDILSLKIK